MLLKERDGPTFSFVSTRAEAGRAARRPGGGAPLLAHARGMPGACRGNAGHCLPRSENFVDFLRMSPTRLARFAVWEDKSWLIGRALRPFLLEEASPL